MSESSKAGKGAEMLRRTVTVLVVVALLAMPSQAIAAESQGHYVGHAANILTTLIDRLEIILPFPARTKALAHLRIAESKLEAIKSAKAGQVGKLVSDYRHELKQAGFQAKKAGGAVVARVKDSTSKHIVVLEGLLLKVPDKAKVAIEHALEVSRRGAEKSQGALKKVKGQEKLDKDQRGLGKGKKTH